MLNSVSTDVTYNSGFALSVRQNVSVTTTHTVMPRIQPPGFYLFFEVKSGGSIRGGVNRGGLINFAPKGRNFLQFLSKSMPFYAV